MAQKAEIANQQKTLRTKAAARTSGAASTQLDHFEKLDVVSKASFGLLGGMAGDIFNAKGRNVTGVAGGLPNAEYLAACKELFEDLCAAIDMPQSVFGQCINACDKLIIDSRPKKIKTGKIDAALAAKLEEDNMGEEEPSSAGSPGGAASKKKKFGTLVDGDGNGGDSDNEEVGDAEAGGEVLDEAQIEERKKQEEAKRLAEEAEQAALRKALEEEERKRIQAEENEAKLRANARVVSSDVPIGMLVMKRDDDDDDLAAFAALGKGKKGGKGGRR